MSGRIRIKLAKMLETAIPGATFQPSRLYRHQSREILNGLASWDGLGIDAKGVTRSVCSWDSMTNCVRYGFDIIHDDGRGFAHWELCARMPRKANRQNDQ